MNEAIQPTKTEAKLFEALRAQSMASEAARHLADESMAALSESGWMRTLVPKRSGGEEAGLRAMAERVRKASEACPAAGWVLMVSLAHDFVIGSFPFEAQDEVWNSGKDGNPDDATPGSLAPGGTLTPVNGTDGADGWRASGRWPFNSGAIHGNWFLLGAVAQLEGPDGEARPALHHIVAPRADMTLEDDWHPLGLKGTGSVDAILEDVFVPPHRAIDSGVLLGTRSEWARQQATGLYRIPILPALGAHIAAAMLGMARPAYRAALETVTGQKDRYTKRAKLERPGLHFRLAEADAELRAAELMMADTLDLLEAMADPDSAMGDGEAPRAKAKMQAAYIGELCRRAVDRLIAGTGARSAFDDSPLQRAFRDLTMAAKHELINFDGSMMTHGRLEVGLDAGGVPL